MLSLLRSLKYFMIGSLLGSSLSFAAASHPSSPAETKLALEETTSSQVSTETPKVIIRFATDATYPPLVSLTPDREVTGFETEVLKMVCQEQNLTCQFSHMAWDNLIPALKAGKIDAIYGGVAVTEQRQKQLAFTKTLNDHNLVGYIIPKDHPLAFTPQALEGKTIGVQTGSTFSQYLQTLKKVQIKRYVSIQDALLDLTATRVDAVFGDTPVLGYFLKSLPKERQSEFLISDITPNPAMETIIGHGYAVAFNPTDNTKPWIVSLDQGLEKLKSTPQYKALKTQFDLH